MPSARVQRPGPGLSRPYHFPLFERRSLHNGLGVVTAPAPKLPLVSVVALVDAGATCDSAQREGTAHLVSKLLLEGTQRYAGDALIERFEQLGATVDAETTWDGAVVSMTVLSTNLAPAFELLSEVLRTPAFHEREVTRLKAEREAELLQLRSEPRGLADESFSRFLYAPASRYARPEAGALESVSAITRDEVSAFYRGLYLPARTTIIMTGDITHEQGERLAAGTLGDWDGPLGANQASDDRQGEPMRQVHIVEKPDAPQVELRIGHVGIPRRHPDFFPVVVMNAILGGLFSSRINLNLREAHGYTYGAFSSFEWRRQAGPFMVSTAVQSDVTAAAAKEIVAEIERMRTESVSEEELSLATSYLEGVFPIQYETTGAIAGALATLVRHDLPNDYFNAYRTHIRTVSTEDVLRVARDHLHPDGLQLVAVGDGALIAGPLQALNLGLLRRHDANWRPISS